MTIVYAPESPVKTPAKAHDIMKKKGIGKTKHGDWGTNGLIHDGEVLSILEQVGVAFLLIFCPFAVIMLHRCLCVFNGHVGETLEDLLSNGTNLTAIFERWMEVSPDPFDSIAMSIILKFLIVELFLMRFVPGDEFIGGRTATGHIPKYTDNGLTCWLISLALYSYLVINGWDSGIVYEKLGEILSFTSILATIFCFILYFKGLWFPSTEDSGSEGRGVLNDYFKGMELHPRIFGWDVKQFTNCRFGMMYWGLAPLCYAHWQINNYGELSTAMAICVILQIVYVSKFFLWEMGYMCSMDIQHDRAGYYLCWGCLCWVPGLYTSSAMYTAQHPVNPSPFVWCTILLLGIFSIWANYDSDRMRQHFRKEGGKCNIWGSPAEFVRAKYVTANGSQHSSLLLCSGWWGQSRHMGYLFEVISSVCWSVPTMSNAVPNYSYVIFLTILLIHRSFRDDARCSDKYGKFWDEYVERVPYRIIPGIF
eukprot:514960_1